MCSIYMKLDADKLLLYSKTKASTFKNGASEGFCKHF